MMVERKDLDEYYIQCLEEDIIKYLSLRKKLL